ncbi:MAG TPA: tRNA (guanosine(37)-N1)-methyltransferase TrmD [Candidatus Acidoferrales bacterium]|nr:tRNA (guanosine(37)-N1)-methyltransferase TrmD [Candidatus Acidoferrales bacterium]
MIRFSVITLFPGIFASPLSHSILKKAQEKGLVSIELVDLRAYATDRHRVTDDYAYGGGQGMVMKPEPLVAAIEDLRAKLGGPRVILLAPQGKVFTQQEAKRLSGEKNLVLVCGRYEGVDERVKNFVDEELSIGDYTLSGGETAALVIIDAVARLVPGVLGNARSAAEDSFSDGLLEYPQYTRPEEYRGMKVPEVLLSGDHERIQAWRRMMSLKMTYERRPDLWRKAALTPAERKTFATTAPVYAALIHHPVYDKNREVVTTAITNMDIHDIARAACTYGLSALYVVHPVEGLQRLAAKIIHHWEHGYGSEYNHTRKVALALARLKATLDDAILEIEHECGAKPALVATSAREHGRKVSFADMKEMLRKERRPFLFLLGTGWGLTETVLAQADYILEPITGRSDYNHLSVRSAAAIIFDRLLA